MNNIVCLEPAAFTERYEPMKYLKLHNLGPITEINPGILHILAELQFFYFYFFDSFAVILHLLDS